jgi:hypothetical protein
VPAILGRFLRASFAAAVLVLFFAAVAFRLLPTDFLRRLVGSFLRDFIWIAPALRTHHYMVLPFLPLAFFAAAASSASSFAIAAASFAFSISDSSSHNQCRARSQPMRRLLPDLGPHSPKRAARSRATGPAGNRARHVLCGLAPSVQRSGRGRLGQADRRAARRPQRPPATTTTSWGILLKKPLQ